VTGGPAQQRQVGTFVLDSGALIALERARPEITALLLQVRAGRARVIVPDAVLAQVWRGGSGRQARIAALLGLKPEQCVKVPLETGAAKRIGTAIGQCAHADVVDVHVALLARQHHAAVVTTDLDDLVKIDAGLADRIVKL
jgi:predicted nucleic acid-binding protein